MNTLELESKQAFAQSAAVGSDGLTVNLTDGRSITAPLAWFPRIAHATEEERAKWRIIGRGQGIHWPDLDEDVSVESLLAGRRSYETSESLRRWLHARKTDHAGASRPRRIIQPRKRS
jgi:hypothetical protein